MAEADYSESTKSLPLRQGSVLSQDTRHELIELRALPPDWLLDNELVVVSHSCDLAGPPQLEPSIELMKGERLEQLDGNYSHAKSARTLHLNVLLRATSINLGLSAHDRRAVDRKAVQFRSDGALDEDARQTLARWLGRRYYRQAFPDQFNERLRHRSQKIRKLLRGQAASISGIYLVLRSSEELEPDEPYEVIFRATMKVDGYKRPDLRSECIAAMDAFVSLVGECPSIDVADHDLVPESDMSLDDLRTFQRWDADDLSYRNPQAERPADG